MSHPHRRIGDGFGYWIKTISVTIGGLLSLLALAGLAWANLAEPRIDKKIETRIEPIEDALRYQNYLMMATMRDEQIKQAETWYKMEKRGGGK